MNGQGRRRHLTVVGTGAAAGLVVVPDPPRLTLVRASRAAPAADGAPAPTGGTAGPAEASPWALAAATFLYGRVSDLHRRTPRA